MQGQEPDGYSDTGESGETYDVEKMSADIRRHQRRVEDKEALVPIGSDAE